MKRPNEAHLAPLVSVAALVLLSVLSALPAIAWQNDQESAPAQENQGYPVIVDGYEVFRVHQNLGAASAEERAERISARWKNWRRARTSTRRTSRLPRRAGSRRYATATGLIVTINDAEAQGSGLPRKALAMQYVKLLQEKLALAREQHTPRYLWWAAA